MAVIKVPQKSSLIVVVSKDGKNKNLIYSGVKPEAGDLAVYDSGTAIAGLQTNPLVAIERQDEGNLLSA
ncbi:MAG: hypothetical protein N3A57_02500 [Negativicutes bacterium]|nr:hypothetical protein [Negativicutes bacterium]